MTQALHVLEVANVKDIFIKGLEKKVAELGELRVPFDISREYPSRETFNNNNEGNPVQMRRIVVKRITETVSHYAIGDMIGGTVNLETLEEQDVQGWLDKNVIEISVWSSDSNDRDNIMQLVKIWVLELVHDIHAGNLYLQTPFFYDNEVFSARFVRAYEDTNRDWKTPTGVMYIGSLIFDVLSPFYHSTEKEYLEQYKMLLTSEIVDCLND